MEKIASLDSERLFHVLSVAADQPRNAKKLTAIGKQSIGDKTIFERQK
jgi:hypothetical protein